MSYSDHVKPVGHCTICNAPVYLVKNQIRRICTCGTANCGNIIHTTGTITALLNPSALTSAIQIAAQSSTEPLLFSSSVDMDQPEDSHSQPAQRDCDALQEEVTPERARRIYKMICLAMRIHRSDCPSCAMLAIQDLTCPTHIAMNDGRLFWSKRLPREEAYSA